MLSAPSEPGSFTRVSPRPSAPAAREPRPLTVLINPCEDEARRGTGSVARHIDRGFVLLFVDRRFSVEPRPTTPIGVNSVCLPVEVPVSAAAGCWCLEVDLEANRFLLAAPGHGKAPAKAQGKGEYDAIGRCVGCVPCQGVDKGIFQRFLLNTCIIGHRRSFQLFFSAIGIHHASEGRDAPQVDLRCG